MCTYKFWGVPFLTNLNNAGLQLYCKKSPVQVFSCKLGGNFEKMLFTEHLQAPSSLHTWLKERKERGKYERVRKQDEIALKEGF